MIFRSKEYVSVWVSTVERTRPDGLLRSIAMAGGKLWISPTWGRPYLGRYRWVKLGKIPLSSRRY